MTCNLTAESAGQAIKSVWSIRWSGSGQPGGGKVRQASQHNARGSLGCVFAAGAGACFLLRHRRLGFRVQGIVCQLCRSRAVDASYRWYA